MAKPAKAHSDYERIAAAIAFLGERVTERPSLDDLAAHLGLSAFHCQRLFARWAGTTPKRFQQVLTLELGKRLLDESRPVLDASLRLGLGSGSRLYDCFVEVDGVTPGEHRKGGSGIRIVHGFAESPFGPMFVATTARGICRAAFVEPAERAAAAAELAQRWPQATLHCDDRAARGVVQRLFARTRAHGDRLTLDVRGTNFQLAVWRALLTIPEGKTTTYARIATAIGRPSAARAVGTAIGDNPVAVLIPCHRVVQATGAVGGYRWGAVRKIALQAHERLQRD
jgi:AraC family transcriptional regulator, regulatory protein of adaptative response / methylated-DNA-[protein]-cysteine methyltransferase